MKATIYKIDRLNTHNGSGFRTVIYFKGCPLHCTWCHNPEGISSRKEVWFNATKCIGCGTCVEMCPENALTLSSKGISIDRKKCTGCQLCTMVCPSKAMEKIGEEYSIDELMKIILQDKFLFESSEGGITVTGGEPGNYPDFIAELFKQCRNVGIHTAFDTSGIVSEKALEKIIPLTNLVFLDIKLLDKKKSLQYAGLQIQKLQQNIHWLNTFQKEFPSLKIEIRTPLVPGINDDNESLTAISQFIQQSFYKVSAWELCLFNDFCEDKYNRMGMKWEFIDKKHTSEDYKRIIRLKEKLRIPVTITGFIERKK